MYRLESSKEIDSAAIKTLIYRKSLKRNHRLLLAQLSQTPACIRRLVCIRGFTVVSSENTIRCDCDRTKETLKASQTTTSMLKDQTMTRTNCFSH